MQRTDIMYNGMKRDRKRQDRATLVRGVPMVLTGCGLEEAFVIIVLRQSKSCLEPIHAYGPSQIEERLHYDFDLR